MEIMRLAIAENEACAEKIREQDRIMRKLLAAASARIQVNEGILSTHS